MNKVFKNIIAVIVFALVSGSFVSTAVAAKDGSDEKTKQATSKKLWENPNGANIVEVAISLNSEGPYAGQFDTLIAAVLAADPFVLSTLTRKGQFTVFAPTDDAFLLLGLDPDTVGTLDQDFLTDVLLYHVAPGRRYSDSVLNARRIRTISKGFLFQNNGTLTDNLGREADIIATDIDASNGVIHAIDTVVLPYAP